VLRGGADAVLFDDLTALAGGDRTSLSLGLPPDIPLFPL